MTFAGGTSRVVTGRAPRTLRHPPAESNLDLPVSVEWHAGSPARGPGISVAYEVGSAPRGRPPVVAVAACVELLERRYRVEPPGCLLLSECAYDPPPRPNRARGTRPNGHSGEVTRRSERDSCPEAVRSARSPQDVQPYSTPVDGHTAISAGQGATANVCQRLPAVPGLSRPTARLIHNPWCQIPLRFHTIRRARGTRRGPPGPRLPRCRRRGPIRSRTCAPDHC